MCERTLKYDPAQRVGVGTSRLGTSQAIAVGAYAFALKLLFMWPVHAT
jgi:glucokinase